MVGKDSVATPGGAMGQVANPLWAEESSHVAAAVAGVPEEWMGEPVRQILDGGITILRGVHGPDLCEQVIAEYHAYLEANRKYARKNLDDLGRQKRLVNFHRTSPACMELGLNPKVLSLMDHLFRAETSLYTSLTFRFGTQQPAHRDTPHFATWPRRGFMGHWVALRDVDPRSGPLFYHRGAHRPPLDPGPFWEAACQQLPKGGRVERLALALDLYNGEVITRAPEWGEQVTVELHQGDAVLWHPEVPHGGMPAGDPMLERWSTVFHCAPRDVQVHQHDAFFTHQDSAPPAPRYGFDELHGRSVGVTGETAFM